jgi:hypothetical protein
MGLMERLRIREFNKGHDNYPDRGGPLVDMRLPEAVFFR